MLSGTHVRQTTLCVTFGARLRLVRPRSWAASLATVAAKTAQALRNGPAERPSGLQRTPKDALQNSLRHARGYLEASRQVSSVGGSAVRTKWPNDIRREAGIGRTKDGDGLNVFRACP